MRRIVKLTAADFIGRNHRLEYRGSEILNECADIDVEIAPNIGCCFFEEIKILGDLLAFHGSGIEVLEDLRVGGEIYSGGELIAGHSIVADGEIEACGDIKAGKNILSKAGIRAGEGILAEGSIRAGGPILAGAGIEAGCEIYAEGDISSRDGVRAIKIGGRYEF